MAAARRSRVKIAAPSAKSAHWRRNGETSPTGSNGRAALRSSRSRSRRTGQSGMNAGRNGRVPRLQRSPREAPESLGSDAKCNAPADLISARLFRTLRSVAMQFYSHLSDDERTKSPFCGPRGRSMGGHCPGARSGENNHLQGAAAERTPLGRVFPASRRRSLPSAQAA